MRASLPYPAVGVLALQLHAQLPRPLLHTAIAECLKGATDKALWHSRQYQASGVENLRTLLRERCFLTDEERNLFDLRVRSHTPALSQELNCSAFIDGPLLVKSL